MSQELGNEQETQISYLAGLKNKAYRRGEEFHRQMTDFANGLLAKYKDAREYRLFHLLIGSAPARGQSFSKFDFPREDSIAKFLEAEARKPE